MKTYREHYDIAKTYYKGELKDSGYKDLYSLKLDADIFDANDQYYNIVSKISEKVHKKINNKDGVLEKNLATYLNEWRDISEMSDLLDHIMPDIESKVFKTNAQVEFLHPYRNKPSSNAESSWLWHYDDCPDEFLKMVIYLNEVNETNGAFQYLENEEGDCPIIHSNRTYPGHTGVPQKFAKSRIPQEEIDKKISEGYKVKNLTGPMGTYCLMSPNIYHRATMPEQNSTPRECLFLFIRPCLSERVKSDGSRCYLNEGVYSLLPERNVKLYPFN
jgi:hypothetical protein